ncbi:DUF6907 domain-containing protein [Streptomyces axinellae]|uniref:Uncharacterized protein n=1 Tax=Streptomyces axinellae TaxID=552788 RepID=A0ABP6D1R2_9ACTN
MRVAPASLKSHPETPDQHVRLRPALVNGAPLRLECPDWCSVDHVAADPFHLADVFHASDQIALPAPAGRSTEDVLVAWLTEYPFVDGGGPVLALDAAGDETAELSAGAALAFADQLVAHAGALRQLAARVSA